MCSFIGVILVEQYGFVPGHASVVSNNNKISEMGIPMTVSHAISIT